MNHAVSLSRSAERRHGVLPYQEFHEINLTRRLGQWWKAETGGTPEPLMAN
jgi:hypothetical protein